METAGQHSVTPVLLPEMAWRTYADRMRRYGERYRKRVDDHVTAAMRQWRAEIGPLADNDWLMFAVDIYGVGTRQMATRNDSRRHWMDFDFAVEFAATFLELVDVDRMLAWNATVIDR